MAADTYETFVRSQTPGLLRLAFLLTGDPEAAVRLVQEALAPGTDQAQLPLDEVDVRNVVRRRLVDSYLSSEPDVWSARMASGVETLNIGNAAALVDSHERDEWNAVLAAIDRLPARQRTVLVLRYHQRLDDEEIAVILRLLVEDVATLTTQAFSRLRDAADLRAFESPSRINTSPVVAAPRAGRSPTLDEVVPQALARRASQTPDPGPLISRMLGDPAGRRSTRQLALAGIATLAALLGTTIAFWPGDDALTDQAKAADQRWTLSDKGGSIVLEAGSVRLELPLQWQPGCRHIVLPQPGRAQSACSDYFEQAPRSEVLVARGNRALPVTNNEMQWPTVKQRDIVVAGHPATVATTPGRVRYGCETECRRWRPRYVSVIYFSSDDVYVQILASTEQDMEDISAGITIEDAWIDPEESPLHAARLDPAE